MKDGKPEFLEDYTSKILLYFVIFVVAIAIVYLLYCQGFAISRGVVAIIFIFHPGGSADRATLDSCTGWVKYVGRFYESKTYEFILDMQLSKGDVEAILLDREKQQLMKLNQQSLTDIIELDAKNRYYLRWEFKGATGKCEMYW